MLENWILFRSIIFINKSVIDVIFIKRKKNYKIVEWVGVVDVLRYGSIGEDIYRFWFIIDRVMYL